LPAGKLAWNVSPTAAGSRALLANVFASAAAASSSPATTRPAADPQVTFILASSRCAGRSDRHPHPRFDGRGASACRGDRANSEWETNTFAAAAAETGGEVRGGRQWDGPGHAASPAAVLDRSPALVFDILVAHLAAALERLQVVGDQCAGLGGFLARHEDLSPVRR